MEEGTRTQLDTEQEKPVLAATSGEGGSYKPMAKGNRAGRESEEFIVPLMPVERSDEGRDPALVMPESRGKRKGMVARPNHPLETRQNSLSGCTLRPSARRSIDSTLQSRRGNVPPEAWNYCLQAACTPHEKTIAKPDAGNPHVRFERGPQETEPVRHRA
jgi:hypothetical protein